MSIVQWDYLEVDKECAKDVAQQCDCTLFCALLLTSRGVTEYSEVDEFLSTDVVFSNPYAIDGIAKAAEIIRNEIDLHGKICVFGDYDCDGVTATALLTDCLRDMRADVIYKVPLREDGYGIRTEDVDSLFDDGVSMIITVDNGICAFEAAERARNLGIRFIITDHHLPKDTLPIADAIVDPHIEGSTYGFKDYAGVGVAFMLACAILQKDCTEAIEDYGDLVALGTVADVVPLLSDNRSFVRYGCEMMTGWPCCGMHYLKEAAGVADRIIDSKTAAFSLAPRVNAAGRMKNANDAVELFLSKSDDDCAELSKMLCECNDDRKKVENLILIESLCIIEMNPECLNYPVLIVKGEDWHFGVLGIVAAKLCNLFSKPCIVMSEQDGIVHGSARSYKGVNIFEVLNGAKEHLHTFGGHELAAGVSISNENYDIAVTAIQQSAHNQYSHLPMKSMDVALKLNPGATTVDTVKVTSALEPFGACNESPVYVFTNMRIDKISPVGKAQNHLRLQLSREDATIQAMCFFTPPDDFHFKVGDVVDLAVELIINYYNDNESLTISIKDVHFSNMNYNYISTGIRDYENYRAWSVKPEGKYITREQVQDVWKNIKEHKTITGNEDIIMQRIGVRDYFCTRIILDVLAELQMIELKADRIINIRFIENPKKNPLINSKTYLEFKND